MLSWCACVETDEDLLLKQALEMSMLPTASDDEQMSAPSLPTRDFSLMSEDEQVAYAMQMSMDPTPIGWLLVFTIRDNTEIYGSASD